MGFALLPRRTRSGVTLVEIMVVVAIMTIMAAVGATIMRDLIPRWRTRRAAQEFAGWVQFAKDRSVAEGVQYRIQVFGDDSLDADNGTNEGIYRIARGDLSMNSTAWDVLPVEGTGVDADASQGTINLKRGTENGLVDVSIEGSSSTPVVIMFSPRGWLDNPATDFSSAGYMTVKFVNKRSHLGGSTEYFSVLLSRSGMTRIVTQAHATSTDVNGVSGTSNTAASTGSGYRGI